MEDAAALIEEFDAAPVAVLGWSAGGVIAASLAANHPSLVSSLVLVEPPLHLITHPTASTLSMLGRTTFRRHVRRDKQAAAATMYRWSSGLSTGGNTFDRLPEEMRRGMLDNADSTLREMDQQTLPYPRKATLRAISCSVTLLIGEHSDSAFQRAGGFIRRLLPDAREVRLADAGHFPHIEQPDAWVSAVREALGTEAVAATA